MVEQRYQAVLQVLDGIPVTEVAERFGVARHETVECVAREAVTRTEPAATMPEVVTDLSKEALG